MKSVPDPLRVAVVGYGLGGSVFHAPFIDTNPRLSLDGIVTANPDRQAAATKRYPNTRLIRSVDELLGHAGEWDLVVVTVPNASHYEVAERAINAGLHTVIDKPITPTSAEAERLAELADHRHVSVIPHQNRRWDGDFLTVTDMLATKRLGEVWRFESRFERWSPAPTKPTKPTKPTTWKLDPNQPGAGILFDLGSHLVDQVLHLFGPPSSVYAERIGRGAPVDNDAFLALTYANGLVAHLWTSSTVAQLGPRFRILGSKAGYVKYGLDPQEDALRGSRLPTEPGWGEDPPERWGRVGPVDASTADASTAGATEPVPTRPGAYQEFYAGVAAHLIDGAAPPVDVADAILGLKVLEAAVASAETRSVVTIG